MGKKKTAVMAESAAAFARFKAKLTADSGGAFLEDDFVQLWDEYRRDARKTPEQREWEEDERARQIDGESVR